MGLRAPLAPSPTQSWPTRIRARKMAVTPLRRFDPPDSAFGPEATEGLNKAKRCINECPNHQMNPKQTRLNVSATSLLGVVLVRYWSDPSI